MKVNSKKKSSIQRMASMAVRDSIYTLQIEYDYDSDITKLILPDKLRLLPRVHALDFLKDAQNLITDEYYQRLKLFTESTWSESEKRQVKEAKHAIEKRKQQKSKK